MIFISQRTRSAVVYVVLVLGVVGIGRTVLRGQAERWYPSRWGANDQRGAANRITPRKSWKRRTSSREAPFTSLDASMSRNADVW
jgi:hypothetical protein